MNRELRWDGSFAGIVPVPLTQDWAEHARKKGPSELLKCFDDPERFMVAHMILTEIYGGVFGPYDDHAWNGLHVTFLDGGKVGCARPEDRLELKAAWKNYIENHPSAKGWTVAQLDCTSIP